MVTNAASNTYLIIDYLSHMGLEDRIYEDPIEVYFHLAANWRAASGQERLLSILGHRGIPLHHRMVGLLVGSVWALINAST